MLSAQSDKKLQLCTLDQNVKLAALDNCFVLDVKNGEKPARYYYSWIGEALRAYILYALRQFSNKHPDDDVQKLVAAVDKLEMSIASASIEMSGNMHNIKSAIEERLNDPIEHEIARRGFLWKLGSTK